MPKYEIGFWYAGQRCFSHLKYDATTPKEAHEFYEQELQRWPEPIDIHVIYKDGVQITKEEYDRERIS